ncbi:hypothetical protein [Kitasatospora griseola]|uniref:hypothetical protein n=1 Tax=Kitasatospora griseola TaxID=2064 RepID=UPI000A604047|nr:hypothetical protein [Kitasatospora griseola]
MTTAVHTLRYPRLSALRPHRLELATQHGPFFDGTLRHPGPAGCPSRPARRYLPGRRGGG